MQSLFVDLLPCLDQKRKSFQRRNGGRWGCCKTPRGGRSAGGRESWTASPAGGWRGCRPHRAILETKHGVREQENKRKYHQNKE